VLPVNCPVAHDSLLSAQRRRTPLLALTLLVFGISASAIEPPATDPAWLEFVGPLITEQEAAVFRRLDRHFERSEFVDRFWRVRDPDPATPRNELRSVWAERMATAEADFDGAHTDRGRAFLLNGPPKFILSDLCTEILRPIEIWVYETPGDDAKDVTTLVFFSADERDMLGLWDRDSQSILDLWRPTKKGAGEVQTLTRRCRRGREVTDALQQAIGSSVALHQSPPNLDWLLDFERSRIAGAQERMKCELEFEYPGRVQERTIVDGRLTVPTEALGSEDRAEIVSVEGEIFRGDRLADRFRYRFDIAPAGSLTTMVDVTFRRLLTPGAYRLQLTVRTLQTGAVFHSVEALHVPTIREPPLRPGGSGTAPASRPTTDTPERIFKIRPVPRGLLTGRLRVDVQAGHADIASVVFLLDGRQVMTKGRPPFSVELDLGRRPRTHTLEALALDSAGEEVARDLVPLNVGPHRFAVRLLEPRSAHRYDERLSIHADVDVPPGEKLDRVDFYLNETRIAAHYQPPFVQPAVALPARGASAYVRAVAMLDDGNSAEDIVIVNTGGTLDHVQVDFVELYASIVDRTGEPVEGLQKHDFTVLEDGIEQPLRRFETVRDLPINAAIVIDTSISMVEEINEAEEAARRFFDSVIEPKDRAAVVVFSDQPQLKVTLTNDLQRLAAGLSGLEADGETTLYDSVVFGLYYLLGLRGKKALILLTDGLDSQSRYSFDETLEFARSAGVAIYPIGLSISPREFEAQRVLRQLAVETGGEHYFIGRASELTRIYDEIQRDLRSQYMLGYQSSQSGADGFRRLEIRVARPDVEVKTIPGYYP